MSQRPLDPSPDPVPLLSPRPNDTIPNTTDLTSVDLDEVLRPHTSRRGRAIQAGGVLAVLLAVIWALLRGVASFLPGSTASAPSITSFSPAIVITSNISFGGVTVTINGRRLTSSLPLLTYAFHKGTNVVTLSAPPFHPHSCSIDWSSSGLTLLNSLWCGIRNGGTYHIHGTTVSPAIIVEVDLDSSDLPSDLAARAYDAAAQALAAAPLHTMVPSSQYYAAGVDRQGHLIVRQAATSLQADVLVSIPDPRNGTGPCSGQMLCAAPLDPSVTVPVGQRIWSVYTFLAMSWRYTSPSGAVTVSPRLLFHTSTQFLLTYESSTRTWSVLSPWFVIGGTSPAGATGATGPGLPTLSEQLASGLCDVGTQVLSAVAQSQNSDGIATPHNQSVAGCQIQLLSADGSTIEGTFLWRFGVLLAVDTAAHTLAPWLPLAPQSEIAAVGG